MVTVTAIGVGIAKSVFQVHAQLRVTQWLERADSTLCRTGRTGGRDTPHGPWHLECELLPGTDLRKA
jgi:hypothetical protein